MSGTEKKSSANIKNFWKSYFLHTIKHWTLNFNTEKISCGLLMQSLGRFSVRVHWPIWLLEKKDQKHKELRKK